LARSVVTQAEKERAYGIILGMPRSKTTEEGQSAVIYDNPSQVVADELRCSLSQARYITRKLSERGLLTYIPNGGLTRPNGHRGHAWLVKLPGDGKTEISRPQAQPLNLNTAMDPSETVEKVNRVLRAMANRLASEKQLTADLQVRIQVLETELAAAREQNDKTAAAINNLKIPDELPGLLQE
jgi:hypothetical protein